MSHWPGGHRLRLVLALLALLALAACAAPALPPLSPPATVAPATVAPATLPPAPELPAPTAVPPATQPPAPQPPTPEPPTPAETASPAPEGDLSWSRAVVRGELVVGTSADYPPFESLVNYTPQGFDVALLEDLGRRLGLPVRFINFAFDGLDNALQLHAVDAVAAALSVTPERLAYADFSDVYYVSQEAVLARTDSPVASIGSMADAARYRIAVQKDSAYEAWVRSNLVDEGKLPEANLATYMLVSDAVNDLKAGRVDLLVLDAPASEEIVRQGGVRIVGRGLTQQQLAIAVPRGAVALRTRLNEALAAARADGTLDRLTGEYLKEAAAPLPPPGTEVPVAEATAPPCVDNLALVAHPNFDPQQPQEFEPGERLTKAWRVRNTGTCVWDGNYTLIFALGNEPENALGGQPLPLPRSVAPGEEIEIAVELAAPQRPGEYQALWQMLDARDEAFGELLPIVIIVGG